MPTIDEKKRLEDLKAEIRHVSDIVVWTEADLKLAIGISSSSITKSLMPLERIEEYVRADNYQISLLAHDFRAAIPLVRDDLRAISESTISSSSSIKNSIENFRSDLLDGVDKISSRSMLATAVPQSAGVGAVSGVGSLLPPTLIKKVELVLDSTAKFIKAWSNPVTVGVALAIPIVGGLGVIFAGAYLIINRIYQSVDAGMNRILTVIEGIADKGLVGWAVSGLGSSGTTTRAISNESSDLVSTIENSRDMLNASIAGLSLYASQISDSSSKLLSKIDISNYTLRSMLTASSMAAASVGGIKSEILGLNRREESRDSVSAASVTYDSEFQNDLITTLKSTISVRVENLPKSDSESEKPAEVFSNALKPLTANQDALLKSLDSGLRRLNDSIVSLREAKEDKNVSMIYKTIDSADARISDKSEQYLLEATRDILSEVRRFYTNFDEFKTVWIGKNGQSIRTENPPDQNLSGA